MPLVRRNDLRKKSILAIGSSAREAASSLEFVGSSGAPSRESGGAQPHAHLKLGGDRRWGREVAGEVVRRHCGLTAVAARLRRRGDHGLANVWHEEHQEILGEASKMSHGCGRWVGGGARRRRQWQAGGEFLHAREDDGGQAL
jgi:hypothetical protein